MAGLSVVIPTLEEASRLPLLLADLQRWAGELEVIVSDGGSRDHTRAVAQLAGATVLDSPNAGRGPQLRWGVGHSSCLLYTSPSPRDQRGSRMPSSA